MQTFKIYTFGCKTNREESEYISQELRNNGFQELNINEKTDFTIINSCSVTSTADEEILYLIRKQKKNFPDTKIILTGCLAQADYKNLAENKDIYMILGNSEKLKMSSYILTDKEQIVVSDLLCKKNFDEFTLDMSKRTRATLKIQDGCNNFCSYCIVPFTRGKSRSSKKENVINNIKKYVENGYKEIVISGIHIGLWGLDFDPKSKLVDLLREIEKIDNLPRYRLGSLDPGELNEELMEFLIKSDKFCNHLHVSLQSANNKILTAMNRHYSIEETIEKLNYLKANIRNINFGADVITGFPGETDEDFNETYNNIKNMPINYMHVFPYSMIQFTKASKMACQIDEYTKKERALKLRELATLKQNKFMTGMLNQNLSVLIEKTKADTNIYKGVSSNYIKFIVESDKNISNTVIDICGTEVKDKKIFAKINNL